MAKIWMRDGVTLTFKAGGKIDIEIDAAKVTAAAELDVIGPIRVYTIDTKKLTANVVAEIKRAPKNLRKLKARFKKKRSKPEESEE